MIENICQMIMDRGLEVKCQNENEILASNDTLIYIFTEKKTNSNNIRSLITNITEKNIKHLIIIYNTLTTKKNMPSNIEIEYFPSTFFYFNPTRHYLVPYHRRANKEEIDGLKKITSLDKIPIIYKTDPISRYYNFEKDEIIKISRRTGQICYRKVV